MRIFERLRGPDGSASGIERKLVKTVVTDIPRRLDDETPVTVMPEDTAACCSCCSAAKTE